MKASFSAHRRTHLHRAVMLAAAILCGCAPTLPSPEGDLGEHREATRPPGFPDALYRALGRGEPVYAIEPARSLVVLEVRRAGRLARLGHDHVVASHDVQGYVAPDARRADLFVRLDELVVDEVDLRNEAGFGARPPDAAVAGTRANMLGPVLHADRHPFATIHVVAVDAGGDLDVAITLDGVTHASRVHAAITREGETIAATGRFALDQTDFGITPLSVLAGAIQVQNRVDVRFAIRARQITRVATRRGASPAYAYGPYGG
jgi:hypothetical protein